MELTTVAVADPGGGADRMAVVLITASSAGIERKELWNSWVLAGAESDEVVLTDVLVADQLGETPGTISAGSPYSPCWSRGCWSRLRAERAQVAADRPGRGVGRAHRRHRRDPPPHRGPLDRQGASGALPAGPGPGPGAAGVPGFLRRCQRQDGLEPAPPDQTPSDIRGVPGGIAGALIATDRVHTLAASAIIIAGNHQLQNPIASNAAPVPEVLPIVSNTKAIVLEERVVRAAEAALAEQKYVSAIDVLVGMGWLTTQAVDQWRQGRVEDLERVVQVSFSKLSTAMAIFRRWAMARGLMPKETMYIARSRDRRPLRFSRSGDADIETAYRTHWVSPELSEAKQRRLVDKHSQPPDLVVIAALREWTCTVCTGTGDLLIMEPPGPLCLGCADLGHLMFLAAGDAALTRRAKKASGLSAVVVRFSTARRRYERQGLLVEEEALAQAEEECLADVEARARRQARDERHRAEHDESFHGQFAAEITRLFPGCPADRADTIAGHATVRHSGRVGRSAAGRALSSEAVTLAVIASVRHLGTPYDRLLMSGVPRREARQQVSDQVTAIVDGWRRND